MDDREYIQDERDTIDLVVWEECIDWANKIMQEDWENWVNSVGWTDQGVCLTLKIKIVLDVIASESSP